MDRAAGARGRHASCAAGMSWPPSPYLVAAIWTLVGLAAGLLVRWASVRLARREGLEPSSAPWQVYGPSLLTALLFGLFGWRLGATPLLLIRSLWVAVLVQVIFFDLEHHLILDRVLLPAALAALLLSLVTPNLGWVMALLAGVGTGLVFLAIAAVGAFLFRAEAMGLGDVKFSAFIGLVLGPRPTLSAILLGVFLAGLVALALVVLRRRTMKDSIAYGPYLAVGTLVLLFTLGNA
jgi:leader peptidase (prepilin peptidase)/N-methyltransferase